MADLQDAMQIVQQLSKEEKVKLLQYLQEETHGRISSGKRVLNLHPGAIVIGDDFNEELPDEFWLGEKE